MKKRIGLLLLALLVMACDDTSGDEDTSTDDTAGVDTAADTGPSPDADADTGPPPELTGTWLEIPKTERPQGQSPDGASELDAALDASEARAGKIADAAAIEDFAGPSAQCRLGDYKLYNNRVAFCIEGPVGFTHVLIGGGKLIDALRLDIPGSVDRLLAAAPDLQLRTAAYDTVEVVSDGSDGAAAVVRASGEDEMIGLLMGLLGSPQLTPAGTGARVVTEYRLEPDSEVLELVTWVSNPEADYPRPSGDIVAFEEAQAYYRGLDLDAVAPTRADFFGGIGPGASYGFYPPREGTALGISELESGPALFLTYQNGRVPVGLEGAYRRHFVVGDGSTTSLDIAMERVRGEEPTPRSPVTVEVSEAMTGDPVPALIFQIRDAEGTTFGAAQTDLTGEARFDLPPGDYTLVFNAWSGDAIPDTALSVADTPVSLSVDAPQTGVLTVSVVEQDAEGVEIGPLPTKLRLEGTRRRVVHMPEGSAEVALPPGDYTVEVSRGLEYDAYTEAITITAGETTAVSAALVHVMPTPGVLAGEFHQHARPSVDSTTPVNERIYANLTDGVDFMAPSDHDVAFDYAARCEELGVSDRLFCLNGVEVSPLYGHINGLGVTVDPTLPSGGALPLIVEDGDTWRQRTPREVVEGLRSFSSAGLVQMNHPRENSALLLSAGYTPGTSLDDYDRERFPLGFDMIEVYNGKRADVLCTVLLDWYSFHNQGYRLIAVGNSDTHDVGRPAGFPRNHLGIDVEADTLTRQALLDAIAAGDLSIAAGAQLEVVDATLGETRSVTADQPFTLRVKVSSPPWARVDTLHVVVNGIATETLSVTSTEADIVDFDADIELSLNGDAYVHFIAAGSDKMSAVYTSETPFAMTNPIYFDVDGDADQDGDTFEPPGLDQPLPEMTYEFCNR